MYRSILVPLDGSPFAEQALPHALALARGDDAVLRLLLVHQTVDAWHSLQPATVEQKWRVALRERESAYLENVAERLRAAGGAHVETTLADGVPAATIARWATDHDVDVIVITTHAQSGAARAWLGGVTDGVIRAGAVPVFVVRPAEHPGDATTAAPPPRRILLAWDGSDGSARALEHAVGLAQATGAELVITHVVTQYSGPTSPFIPHAAQLGAEVAESRRQAADEELASVVRALADRDPPFTRVRAVTTIHTGAATGILKAAAEHDADLIVTGTHGRGGVARTLLGSVADKLIRGAHTPVLVCRQPRG